MALRKAKCLLTSCQTLVYVSTWLLDFSSEMSIHLTSLFSLKGFAVKKNVNVSTEVLLFFGLCYPAPRLQVLFCFVLFCFVLFNKHFSDQKFHVLFFESFCNQSSLNTGLKGATFVPMV